MSTMACLAVEPTDFLYTNRIEWFVVNDSTSWNNFKRTSILCIKWFVIRSRMNEREKKTFFLWKNSGTKRLIQCKASNKYHSYGAISLTEKGYFFCLYPALLFFLSLNARCLTKWCNWMSIGASITMLAVPKNSQWKWIEWEMLHFTGNSMHFSCLLFISARKQNKWRKYATPT